jgi:hypothetical protein
LFGIFFTEHDLFITDNGLCVFLPLAITNFERKRLHFPFKQSQHAVGHTGLPKPIKYLKKSGLWCGCQTGTLLYFFICS